MADRTYESDPLVQKLAEETLTTDERRILENAARIVYPRDYNNIVGTLHSAGAPGQSPEKRV